jgi:hypothetical protein
MSDVGGTNDLSLSFMGLQMSLKIYTKRNIPERHHPPLDPIQMVKFWNQMLQWHKFWGGRRDMKTGD